MGQLSLYSQVLTRGWGGGGGVGLQGTLTATVAEHAPWPDAMRCCSLNDDRTTLLGVLPGSDRPSVRRGCSAVRL